MSFKCARLLEVAKGEVKGEIFFVNCEGSTAPTGLRRKYWGDKFDSIFAVAVYARQEYSR